MMKTTRRYIVLVMLLCLLSLAASSRAPRYVSPWTRLEPGETVTFVHELGTRPLLLQGWVALWLNKTTPNFDVVAPLATYPALRVQGVSTDRIVLENTSLTDAYFVQVIAEP